jgi:uncharacterized membrane protein YfcA
LLAIVVARRVNGMPLKIPNAIRSSIEHTLSFLPINRNIMSGYLPRTEFLVGIVQSLFGAIFLFLIALALRNRFRMK